MTCSIYRTCDGTLFSKKEKVLMYFHILGNISNLENMTTGRILYLLASQKCIISTEKYLEKALDKTLVQT